MTPTRAKGGSTEADESCLQFQSLLPGYLEGENHALIPTHAAECEYCRCLLLDLEGIRKVSGELTEEEPPAAVWSAIRSTLIEEGVIRTPKSFWQRWLPGRGQRVHVGFLSYPVPIAAAVVVALAAVVLFKSPGYLVRSPLPPATIYTLHAAAFMQGSAAPQDTTALRQTVSEMEQTYRAQQSSFEPSMRATYEKSLSSLDNEIHECQVSMQQEPENRLTEDYLSNAYAEKIQLLQSALEYNSQ
ncbi:MAG: hypothetical protein ACRD19_15260 [Terriglobia bacterium]